MRRHAVLVPGFVGFDALGGLPYYAGVSSIFRQCRECAPADQPPLSVHYFDNHPTAAVATRAKQLRRFLAKRVVRGEFAPDDQVVLIGHSTGGLDIRRLLLDLGSDPDGHVTVDVDCQVPHQRIRGHIHRLVFLSVPHFGTRLADISGPLGPWLQTFAHDAARAIAVNRGWRARLRTWLTPTVADTRTGLAKALLQALDDSDELGEITADDRASARSARMEWAAWLEHMSHDLGALSDLRAEPPAHVDVTCASPAHFDHDTRAWELSCWPDELVTRSYATYVDPASVRVPTPVLGLAEALVAATGNGLVGPSIATLGSAAWAVPRPNAFPVVPLATHLLEWFPRMPFELFYTACASARNPLPRPEGLPPQVDVFGEPRPRATDTLEPTDNDGVVNTLSMLWPWEPTRPDRHTHVLVEADHGDIIGHGPPTSSTDRRRSYDLFQAPTPLTAEQLAAVWRDVYAFCVDQKLRDITRTT